MAHQEPGDPIMASRWNDALVKGEEGGMSSWLRSSCSSLRSERAVSRGGFRLLDLIVAAVVAAARLRPENPIHRV